MSDRVAVGNAVEVERLHAELEAGRRECECGALIRRDAQAVALTDRPRRGERRAFPGKRRDAQLARVVPCGQVMVAGPDQIDDRAAADQALRPARVRRIDALRVNVTVAEQEEKVRSVARRFRRDVGDVRAHDSPAVAGDAAIKAEIGHGSCVEGLDIRGEEQQQARNQLSHGCLDYGYVE